MRATKHSYYNWSIPFSVQWMQMAAGDKSTIILSCKSEQSINKLRKPTKTPSRVQQATRSLTICVRTTRADKSVTMFMNCGHCTISTGHPNEEAFDSSLPGTVINEPVIDEFWGQRNWFTFYGVENLIYCDLNYAASTASNERRWFDRAHLESWIKTD